MFRDSGDLFLIFATSMGSYEKRALNFAIRAFQLYSIIQKLTSELFKISRYSKLEQAKRRFKNYQHPSQGIWCWQQPPQQGFQYWHAPAPENRCDVDNNYLWESDIENNHTWSDIEDNQPMKNLMLPINTPVQEMWYRKHRPQGI